MKEKVMEILNINAEEIGKCSDKLKDINPDLLIVQADSQELLDNKLKNTPVWTSLKAVQNNKVIYADYSTYMLGFGIVSQEAIMKQISDEWGLN